MATQPSNIATSMLFTAHIHTHSNRGPVEEDCGLALAIWMVGGVIHKSDWFILTLETYTVCVSDTLSVYPTGKDVPCNNTVACEDANTCCKTAEDEWVCCPLPKVLYIHCYGVRKLPERHNQTEGLQISTPCFTNTKPLLTSPLQQTQCACANTRHIFKKITISFENKTTTCKQIKGRYHKNKEFQIELNLTIVTHSLECQF